MTDFELQIGRRDCGKRRGNLTCGVKINGTGRKGDRTHKVLLSCPIQSKTTVDRLKNQRNTSCLLTTYLMTKTNQGLNWRSRVLILYRETILNAFFHLLHKPQKKKKKLWEGLCFLDVRLVFKILSQIPFTGSHYRLSLPLSFLT